MRFNRPASTRLATLCLMGLILLGLFLSPSFQTATAASAPTSQPNTVTTTVTITPDYTLYAPSISETVNTTIDMRPLIISADTQARFLSSFKPRQVLVQAVSAKGNVTRLLVSQISGALGSETAYYFTVPRGTVALTGFVTGTATGEGFLWRHVTHLPFLLLNGLGTQPTYDAQIVLPSSSIISAVYAYDSSALPVPASTKQSGEVSYVLDPSASAVVVQSALFVPISLALIVVAVATVVLISLGVLAQSGRIIPGSRLMQGLSRAFAEGRKLPTDVYIGTLSVLRLRGPTGNGERPKLFGIQRRKWHTTLLVLFILSGTLMVSAGALAGPSPALKAYVIASPSTLPQIERSLQSIYGGTVQVVTPSQDYSDFQVMSSVGTFNLVVISDYPTLAVPEVEQFVLPNLGNVPLVIVDHSADPTFVSEVTTLYGEGATGCNLPICTVQNAGQLTQNEAATLASFAHGIKPTNVLGLQLGTRGYDGLVVFEGFMSLVLVFLGFAAVAAMASQSGRDDEGDTLSRVASIVAVGVFVFFFAEVVYVTTSAVITLPLSLHAVISGSQSITAIGRFGQFFHLPFGGGSTPRLAAGVLGVLVGALGTGRAGPFNRKSFLLMVSLAAILLLNPFAVGQFAFQGILLFLGNVSFGGAYQSTVTVKGILYGIGAALGGVASPFYLLSAGKILYFAGLVPLAFLKKMGRTTASLALLMCSLMVGDGGVRVGEMTPEKTAIAVMPGLIAGLGLVLVFLLLSGAEKYLVRNYQKMQPS